MCCMWLNEKVLNGINYPPIYLHMFFDDSFEYISQTLYIVFLSSTSAKAPPNTIEKIDKSEGEDYGLEWVWWARVRMSSTWKMMKNSDNFLTAAHREVDKVGGCKQWIKPGLNFRPF